MLVGLEGVARGVVGAGRRGTGCGWGWGAWHGVLGRLDRAWHGVWVMLEGMAQGVGGGGGRGTGCG